MYVRVLHIMKFDPCFSVYIYNMRTSGLWGIDWLGCVISSYPIYGIVVTIIRILDIEINQKLPSQDR